VGRARPERASSSEAIGWEVPNATLQGAVSHAAEMQNSLLPEVAEMKSKNTLKKILVAVNITIQVQLPSLRVLKPLTARRREAAGNTHPFPHAPW